MAFTPQRELPSVYNSPPVCWVSRSSEGGSSRLRVRYASRRFMTVPSILVPLFGKFPAYSFSPYTVPIHFRMRTSPPPFYALLRIVCGGRNTKVMTDFLPFLLGHDFFLRLSHESIRLGSLAPLENHPPMEIPLERSRFYIWRCPAGPLGYSGPPPLAIVILER